MTYRPHRPHALYAPVTGWVHPQRRHTQRSGMSARSLTVGPRPQPGLLVGLLYGLPPALLLWAIIVATAKAVF